MKTFAALVLISLAALSLMLAPVRAQSDQGSPTAEPTPEESVPPVSPQVHIVQEGETLTSIAQLYSTSVQLLQQLNNIADPSVLHVGQELIVPGSEGDMTIALHVIEVGDTLAALAATYGTSVESIGLTNRLVNPDQLVAGRSLTVIGGPGSTGPLAITGQPHVIQPGDTPLTVAVQHGLSRDAVMAAASANGLQWSTYLYPGQRLRLPGGERYQYLPGTWGRVLMYPSEVTQGGTVAIYVENLAAGQPEGTFANQSLRFAPFDNGYLALAGLDAFVDTGVYELRLGGAGDRPWHPFSQHVEVISGDYVTQYITIPEDLTYLLAPEVRTEEDAFLATVFDAFDESAQWEGLFQAPVTQTVVTAGYGDARSYNQGPIEIYHTGVDFAGTIGTPIVAPAGGTVIFSDTLQLRGNTLIIDHGLGVMTGYYHLSEILVVPGEKVAAGQLIAKGGSTGLSSGPHLHWDLRIGNVPVDPLLWTSEHFPPKLTMSAEPP